MKPISILLFVILSVCVFTTHGAYFNKNVKYADGEFLQKQQVIFEFFLHQNQPEVFPKIYKEVKDYNFAITRDLYKNTTIFDDFYSYYEHKLLVPRDGIFSPLVDYQMKQAIALFKLFYHARDWETFYKVTTWAKYHVQPNMFLYALSVAVVHRKDMAGIVLPAPYEFNPNLFFPSKVIEQAQRYKMQGFHGHKKVNDRLTAYVKADYTSSLVHLNEDQRIAYLTEDVGFNAQYYHYFLDYPTWMGGDEFGLNRDRRGEFYIHLIDQYVKRYNLERRSNGLGEIPRFSWYGPIKSGYYSNLRYYNGDLLPNRDNNYLMNVERNYNLITRVKRFEQRLYDVVDKEYFNLPNGERVSTRTQEFVDIYGNMLQNNADNVFRNYYGNILNDGKRIIGGAINSVNKNYYVPSVNEQYETVARDPVNYQFMNYIMDKVRYFKSRLPPYTRDELHFRGVNITSVEMEPLYTFFDVYDSDITNAVDVEVYNEKRHNPADFQKFGQISNYQGEDLAIFARQKRLNHKAFSFTLRVWSEVKRSAVVLVYMGLKTDVHGHVLNINEKRQNMYELDKFYVDLNAGENKIVRNSNDYSWYVKDTTTIQEVYKQIMLAIKGEQKFPLDMTEAHCGIPRRLMLPKGRVGGEPYQFFYMVVPFKQPKVKQFTGYDSVVSCGVGSGARYLDTLPLGFPFDRTIDDRHFYSSNMVFYDTLIYHKKETEVNAVLQRNVDF